jgi:hypothetical protein
MDASESPAMATTRGYALSPIQRQLWALAQSGPAGSLAYNISINLRVHGPLDRGLLRAAIAALWNRHDALRTSIAAEGTQQRVHANLRADAKWVDLTQVAADDQGAALAAQIARNNDQPFDFDQGPLFRLRVYKLSDAHHVLMLTAHHIVSDGWSLSLLMQELMALYAAVYTGDQADLPEAMQFGDFLQLRKCAPMRAPPEASAIGADTRHAAADRAAA